VSQKLKTSGWQMVTGDERGLLGLGPALCWAMVAFGLALGTVGCGGLGHYVWVDAAPEEMHKAITDAEISEGDVVAVRVFGQDALSVQATIGSNGLMAVPLIGEVLVSGRTTESAARELEQKLAPFVNAPRVTVVIAQSQTRVVVAGEVRRPGTVVLDSSTGVLAALANAGGLTEFAADDRIFVLRPGPGGTARVRFRYEDLSRGVSRAGGFQLRTGDQVVVE
jgi:polysaccharide export outer membrane protein